tara:strand:+ start:1516 stop:2490 length:975 start_codon:yes stop_codon:yes gene_type:complete
MKKILGIGNPIVDEIAFIEETFLKQIDGAKGGMELLDEDQLEAIKSLLPKKLNKIPGGSAGNTAFALARLGTHTGYLGKVGNCPTGNFYKESFTELGGFAHAIKVGDRSNGNCLSLVTPDGQRTMRTSLGAAMHLSADEITKNDIAGYDHVHIEGYMIHNKDVLYKSLDLAKSNNCTVSYDLASFEIVNSMRDEIKTILSDYVDLLFANEDEAAAFTSETEFDPMHTAQLLNQFSQVAVVKLGANGSIIASENKLSKVEAVPVDKVVDTTGAGDLWAAGFLHGWAIGKSLEESAEIGSLLGAAVVQTQGSSLDESQWDSILKTI